MTLAELKDAIEQLPGEDRTALASWLADLEREDWDDQIRHDFSPGGPGLGLLEEVDAQIDRGNFKKLG
jgi:hypothetical protein